eukprot:915873_1
MSTETHGEGNIAAPAMASAPPEEKNQAPIYPVLSQPGQQPQYQQYQQQQPQQVIYSQPQQPQQQQIYANAQPQQVIYSEPNESKQLDSDITNTFTTLIELLNNKKTQILNECLTANNEQRKDILNQLQALSNNINSIIINPNIKPKPKPQPQQQQQIVVIQQQPSANIKYITDTWNTQISHHHLLYNTQNNSVCRSGKRGEWLNCYGNQIIMKGQYKKWEVKIIPKFKPKKTKDHIADVVIGVVNAKKISDRAGGFWLGPQLGYAYYGYSGKKFHTNRKGKAYSDKFNINDTISVEINMKDFELHYYVNGKHKGKAFPIDARLEYCFAAALCSPDYDLQIC